MIAFPAGTKVWIAGGVTDMRRGMNTLALQVQEGLERDPHAGGMFCFRGRRGDLVKILWHDGVGMSLYLKRLEAGKFIWPPPGAARRKDCPGPPGLARVRGATVNAEVKSAKSAEVKTASSWILVTSQFMCL